MKIDSHGSAILTIRTELKLCAFIFSALLLSVPALADMDSASGTCDVTPERIAEFKSAENRRDVVQALGGNEERIRFYKEKEALVLMSQIQACSAGNKTLTEPVADFALEQLHLEFQAASLRYQADVREVIERTQAGNLRKEDIVAQGETLLFLEKRRALAVQNFLHFHYRFDKALRAKSAWPKAHGGGN